MKVRDLVKELLKYPQDYEVEMLTLKSEKHNSDCISNKWNKWGIHHLDMAKYTLKKVLIKCVLNTYT